MQRRRRVEAMRWLAQELLAGRLQRPRKLVG
jgi:hypothetical protein